MVPDETWRNEAVKKLAKALTSLQLGLEAVEEGVDVRSFSFARPVGPTARPQSSPAGLDSQSQDRPSAVGAAPNLLSCAEPSA